MSDEKETNITKKPRILVLDDDKDVVLTLKVGLEKNDFVVDAFNDPAAALRSFRAGVYHLLLVDIRMPKMNGFEFYREIEKIDSRAKV